MTHKPSNTIRSLRLGTRGSKLARAQAEWTAGELVRSGASVALVEIATLGDQEAAAPIGSLGGTGVFTKEVQHALLSGKVDLVVHSMKDLPTDSVDGLVVAAIPPRENVDDVLVTRAARSLEELPAGARVGTGSLRRQAQLLHVRPDLDIREIRGNVDTRLRKLDAAEFDALVLAAAGLRRLGLAGRITEVLSPPRLFPAVGQGALAIECRREDAAVRQVLSNLDHPPTRACVLAERALLANLRGGCLAPIGASCQIENRELRLSAVVLSRDGSRRLLAADAEAHLDSASAEALGRRVADALLADGAAELISGARTGTG